MRTHAQLLAVLGLATSMAVLGSVPTLTQSSQVPTPGGQEITGVPGSPTATVTIDGKQLPPPPLPFGGVIKETAPDSTPYWPPRVVPPKGAPNVLLIMTDDQGYGVSSTFGGVIPTPALDRVAGTGLALHGVPLHGAVLAYAGGADHRPQSPLGRLRRDRRIVHRLPGIRFDHRPGERHHRHDPPGQWLCHLWFGKNHNTPGLSIQRGRAVRPMAGRHGLRVFLRIHGRRDRPVDALSVSQSRPSRIPWIGKPGYNFTTDMADDAINHMRDLNASAPTSRSSSTTCPAAATHRTSRPRNGLRSSRANSTWAGKSCASRSSPTRKRLGVIPASTQLTPWPDGQAAYAAQSCQDGTRSR